MLVQHVFNLARVHVVPATNDQILVPADDPEVPVRVDPGEVFGVEPAVADRGGRGLGTLPVPLHHVVTADHDLAGLALRHLNAAVVDDPHLHSGDGGADRAGLAWGVQAAERGDRRGLRQPVPFEHDAIERGLEGAQHPDRNGRATGDGEPEPGDVIGVPVRRLQQSAEDRRNPGEDRHPVLGQHLQRLPGVEAR